MVLRLLLCYWVNARFHIHVVAENKSFAAPRLIEKFLERQCFLGTVPDVTNVPNSDQFVRKAILDSQVS